MSDIVIEVDNLSKHYRLGVIGGKRLVDDVSRHWARLTGKPDPLAKIGANNNVKTNGHNSPDADELWALRDVSFDVHQGEVLGIIGRNGAGKSTLLKVLSRVTAPTHGEVRVKGRIASLLEVGTGFHPELTGRENVFLNGAILGMTKAEIRSKFDEIVEFAEVSKFIDTPVKRYSSGMYVRLAFAVAAHLEPEILIVDEVLAVGDAEFQKKCLGKMGDVASQGRTVLFVSHNMVAVQTLCQRAIMLREGRLTGQGNPAEMITEYLQGFNVQDQISEWKSPETAPGNDLIKIKSIKVVPESDQNEGLISMQDQVNIETEFWSMLPDRAVHLTYHLLNEQGIVVFTTWSNSTKYDPGVYRSTFQIPGGFLNSGIYHLKLLIVENGARATYTNNGIASFNVVDLSSRDGAYMGKEPGVVQPVLQWRTESVGNI
ncbi:MAG: ABC transporter ATP-binding protein [Chloracidobacterium sp.]|nr:ABC transporter ATP-binding protein [Chloracidobacterium sp.]